jgi:undecaprenyl diphosphate synthase
MSSQEISEPLSKIPTHIAVIMDGNGRWATSRGLPRMAGHQAGTENLRRIIRACVKYSIQYLTFYAFSTENWGRPDDEVQGLMQILADVIDRELAELHAEGVQIRHIGRLDRLPVSLRDKVQHAVEVTRNNTRLTLCVALNYGGRDEIVCAIQRMIGDQISPDQVDANLVSQYMFTAGVPDPDLVIRTSGEMRISNFLIWQTVYSEWYVTPTYWPDFDENELLKALRSYDQRNRRYGKLAETGCVTDPQPKDE